MRRRIHASRTLGLELWIRTLHLGTARRRYSRRWLPHLPVACSEYEIEDTWNVMGSGYGFKRCCHSRADFVPEHRTHKQMDGFNCVNDQEKPHVRLVVGTTFVRVVNSAAIGALKKAVRCFRSSSKATRPLT